MYETSRRAKVLDLSGADRLMAGQECDRTAAQE